MRLRDGSQTEEVLSIRSLSVVHLDDIAEMLLRYGAKRDLRLFCADFLGAIAVTDGQADG